MPLAARGHMWPLMKFLASDVFKYCLYFCPYARLWLVESRRDTVTTLIIALIIYLFIYTEGRDNNPFEKMDTGDIL